MNVHFDDLFAQSNRLIRQTKMGFRRYLVDYVRWNNRLIGIKGPRGTGKTTMVLQWLKQQELLAGEGAYFSLDDLHFTRYTLKETAVHFFNMGGKILVLDEVHKYPDWAMEIKNLYDFYPELKIVFTGSSIIDISKQEGDLSRRALMYELPGLSFREYLAMKSILSLDAVPLAELTDHAAELSHALPRDFRPLQHLSDYLRYGYYPFAIEDEGSLHQRLHQLARTIVEYDMAELRDFDVRNARKLLQLLYIIAQQVPFKPNISSLAQKTSIHRNSMNNYLQHLHDARLITLLLAEGRNPATLQKPDKIYLQNTNLIHALSEAGPESGTVRETFVLSQLTPHHTIAAPLAGDFLVDGQYTLEVGGKRKGKKQLAAAAKGLVVRDGIEEAVPGVLPMWMLGLVY